MLNQGFILFISFGIADAIDILLVAIMLYQLYKMVKGTAAVNVFIGLALIYVVWIIVRAFDLKLLSSILGKFINVGVIAIMVVFQQEIRKFLLYIGSNEFIKSRNWRSIFSFTTSVNVSSKFILDVDSVVSACFNMSEIKTGALIIISRKSDLKFYINTGEVVDSALTDKMLETDKHAAARGEGSRLKTDQRGSEYWPRWRTSSEVDHGENTTIVGCE